LIISITNSNWYVIPLSAKKYDDEILFTDSISEKKIRFVHYTMFLHYPEIEMDLGKY